MEGASRRLDALGNIGALSREFLDRLTSIQRDALGNGGYTLITNPDNIKGYLAPALDRMLMSQ